MLLQQLNEHFAIKDMSDLHYFLGMEVTRKDDILVLTESKYAADLLACVNMKMCT
jgi:hypothetical protein